MVQIIIEHELPGLLAMHRDRGLMEGAAEWLAEQYTVALGRRLTDPLFDLQPFTRNRINHVDLGRLLRTMLPCDIIIERAGEIHKVERDVIVSFGMPGLTSLGYSLSDILRTLQAQVDFVLAHLGTNSFGSSVEVERQQAAMPDDAIRPCPFYTACGLDLRRNQAETCFRRPWRIFNPSGTNCWYGTAVSCTLGVTRYQRHPRPAGT